MNTQVVVRSLALSGVLAAAVVGEAFGQTQSELASWYEPAEPTRIVGPTSFVGTGGLGVYLITTSDGRIPLGGGVPQSGPQIEASMRKLGFDSWVDTELSTPGFEDNNWRLVSFTASNGVTLLAGSRSQYIVAFLPDGSLAARIDCNESVGTWRVGGLNQIALSRLWLSPARCPEHALTDLSDRLYQDWHNLTTYTFQEGRLLIASPGPQGGWYEFEPVGAANRGSRR